MLKHSSDIKVYVTACNHRHIAIAKRGLQKKHVTIGTFYSFTSGLAVQSGISRILLCPNANKHQGRWKLPTKETQEQKDETISICIPERKTHGSSPYIATVLFQDTRSVGPSRLCCFLLELLGTRYDTTTAASGYASSLVASGLSSRLEFDYRVLLEFMTAVERSSFGIGPALLWT